MQCNVGKMDRALRMIIGLTLIGFAIAPGNPIGFVGIVPLITGLVRRCSAVLHPYNHPLHWFNNPTSYYEIKAGPIDTGAGHH